MHIVRLSKKPEQGRKGSVIGYSWSSTTAQSDLYDDIQNSKSACVLDTVGLKSGWSFGLESFALKVLHYLLAPKDAT